MSDMVERVARAIAGHDLVEGTFIHEHSFRLARAAIEAMREPTEAMLDAADADYHYPPEAAWAAMIDAALATPPEPQDAETT